MKKAFLFLFLLAWAHLHAGQRFAFALPDLEGRISLGVFDKDKKLVRTLAVDATEKDFTIGLNGLIAAWDGLDDAGKPVAAGSYHVRGYVVGKAVKSEGEAFHFNDWVESEDSPRVTAPGVIWAAGRGVVLSGLRPAPPEGLVGEITCRYSEDGGLQELRELPAKAQFRGAGGNWAIFDAMNDKGFFALNLSQPEQSFLQTENWQPCAAAAFWKGRLYLAPAFGAVSRKVRVFSGERLATAEAEIDPPANLLLLDANDTALIASDHHAVWIYRDDRFKPVPFAEPVFITSLSSGMGDTFWVVGQTEVDGIKGPYFVRQYGFDGEVLRQLAGDFQETRIFADKAEEKIYLTQALSPYSTIVKGLRPLTPSAGGQDELKVADWEVFLEKKAVGCEKFGYVNGELIPDDNAGNSKVSTKVELAPVSLDNHPHAISLHATAREGKIWLTDSAGLRLTEVGTLAAADRCLVVPGADGHAVRVFAGNSTVVAEYGVTGIDQIAEINAGEIDLP